jgi:very-short-patch-repair endonuclease
VRLNNDIVRVAAEQDGALSQQQLDGAAISALEKQRLVAHGWLRKVAPRTFIVAGSPDTHRRRLHIGLLSLGERSWVSYEAAASLHQFDRSKADAVEFTVERSRRSTSSCLIVHSSNRLPAIDLVVVDGFRTMSATRTILDLAHARSSPARIEAAIDSAVRLSLSSPKVLEVRLTTLRGSGRWGCRLVDSMIDDSGGHTMLERRFLELVREANLPRPLTQVIHRKGARHIARVDFLFEDFNVVVEVSGKLGHSTPSERARDAQRRNELQDVGRKVFEYTWEDVTQDPRMVQRTLRSRLLSNRPAA